MQSNVKKRLESRMQGNLHVRFGVGVRVKLPGLHHGGWPTNWTCSPIPLTPGLSRSRSNCRMTTSILAIQRKMIRNCWVPLRRRSAADSLIGRPPHG